MAVDGASTNPTRWNAHALDSPHHIDKNPEIMDTSDIESNIAGPIGTSIDETLSQRNSQQNLIPAPTDTHTQTGMMSRQEPLLSGDISMSQFDMISSNISETIQKMTEIYNQIGFSESEISVKKSEIFTVISETITNFTSKLQREKSTIENECEWLRQHIKIILAMIDDNKGEATLSTLDRGVVFVDQTLYEQGYMHQVRDKLVGRDNTFYNTSPFNTEATPSDLDREQKYQDMMKEIPELSLLQVKSKLNCIFLEVLKSFIVPFKKLVFSALTYKEQFEIVGEMYSSNPNLAFIKSLPGKDDLEEYSKLIEDFEIMLRTLKLEKGVNQFMHINGGRDHTFIVSSPRKVTNKQKDEAALNDTPTRPHLSTEDPLVALKEINYQLIRSIRSLKYTKITDDVLYSIKCEIDYCEKEITKRSEQVIDIIDNCLSNIKVLFLSNEQIIEIQKQHDISASSDSLSNEGYFDIDTVTFIKQDPKNFGLKDEHINYLSRFSNILSRKKENKQKKYDSYVRSCVDLWRKFGESEDYINQFLAANNSLSDISLLNFKIELNQLIIKRSKYIEEFILNTRQEIETFWNKLFYTMEERQLFKHYNNDKNGSALDANRSGFSEEKEQTLLEHEQELERLKNEYAEKEKILLLNDQLKEILKDKDFLRESSKDSSRLLSKNSCKILLNEEKLRKKIHKQLPKIVENLKGEIRLYNQKKDTILKFNGQDFYETITSIGEKESLKPNNNRTSSSRINRSSPTKIPNKIAKGSPVKPKKSPFTSASQRNALSNKRSPQISPQVAARRPFLNRSRAPVNPTAIKLTNAFSTSIGSNSTVTSLESPERINSIKRQDSRLTHLKPLNNPLVPHEHKNIQIYDENETVQIGSYSSSRLSPLGLNNPSRLNTSSSPGMGNQSSPKRGYDKENFSFDVSPVKIAEKTRQVNSSRRLSVGTCDSSTLIGDDYQTWRDERIKQFNVQ